MRFVNHCILILVSIFTTALGGGGFRCLLLRILCASTHGIHTHLSGDNGYFWYSGLCKSEQQFGSVSDDASVLLSSAW